MIPTLIVFSLLVVQAVTWAAPTVGAASQSNPAVRKDVHTYDTFSGNYQQIGTTYPGYTYSEAHQALCDYNSVGYPYSTPDCVVGPGATPVNITAAQPFFEFVADFATAGGNVTIQGRDAAGTVIATTTCVSDYGSHSHCGVSEAGMRSITLVGVPFFYAYDTAVFTVGITECNDGIDNDGDGKVDHPADPGCSSATDGSELAECPHIVTGVMFCLETGNQVTTQTLREVAPNGGAPHAVKGHVDNYRFTLPNGAGVTVPCVTMLVGTLESNPCATAGASFVGRTATLVDTTISEPVLGEPVVAVCEAEIAFLVNGFGVESAPAYGIC